MKRYIVKQNTKALQDLASSAKNKRASCYKTVIGELQLYQSEKKSRNEKERKNKFERIKN